MEYIDTTGTDIRQNLEDFAGFDPYAMRFRQSQGMGVDPDHMLLDYYIAWKFERMYQALLDDGEDMHDLCKAVHEITNKMVSAFQTCVESTEAGDLKAAAYHAIILAAGAVKLRMFSEAVHPLVSGGVDERKEE